MYIIKFALDGSTNMGMWCYLVDCQGYANGKATLMSNLYSQLGYLPESLKLIVFVTFGAVD